MIIAALPVLSAIPNWIFQRTLACMPRLRKLAVAFLAAAVTVCGAAQVKAAATATTLTVTSTGSAVTTITSGSVVTLTATVKSGTAALTTGQVNFCDASATYCTDVHLLGAAQLTSAGSAIVKLRPGIGTHSYRAMFVGTNTESASSSGDSPLTVTGAHVSYPSTTTIAEAGSWGHYTLTASVTEMGGKPAPTGTASFLDTGNGNAVLATANFGAGTPGLNWLNLLTPIVGSEPEAVAVGDFNGDGIPDLATCDFGGTTVTILLGKGDGTFSVTANRLTVPSPGYIVAADFNGDGKLDLAVTSYSNATTLSIFLGNGDSTFKAVATGPAVVPYAAAVTVADFNGDGIPDMAVSTPLSGIISILLGKGDGTFSSTQITLSSMGCFPGIASGDFNGDNKADLVLTNDCEYNNGDPIRILLGNGDGTFLAGPTPQTGIAASSVVVADFNGDGRLDLAIANSDGNALSIFLNNGSAAFTETDFDPSFPEQVSSLAFGDFNGDGIADLALPNAYNNTVTIYQGNGDGTFTPSAVTPATGNIPVGITVEDFNGDGEADIVVVNSFDDTVSVLLSQPTETATATATGVVIATTGEHLVDASYPGDENYNPSVSGTTPLWGEQPATAITLALTSGSSPVITVSSGSIVTLTAEVKSGSNPVTAGQVNFCDASAGNCTDIHLLGSAQLTSNGSAEFKFVPGPGAHSYKAVFLENGFGQPSASGVLALTVTPPAGVIYPSTTTIAQSGTIGHYSLTATVMETGGTPSPTGTVSFLDTSYSNAVLSTATLGVATPGWSWLNSQTPATGSGPIITVVGDFNLDGKADLAVLNQSSSTVTILLGNGDGTFTPSAKSPAVGSEALAIAVGDFNGDGKPDLAVASEGVTGSLTILLGKGDGTFTPTATSPAVGQSPTAIVVADFNGDGILDLAVSIYNQSNLTILLGKGDGTFTLTTSGPIPNEFAQALAAADLNGDGILDLVAQHGTGTIEVLLGNGDGTFRTGEMFSSVTNTASIAIGDLNGDGKLDLVVSNNYQEAITAFLGNGDGTFAQTGIVTTTTQAEPQNLVVADFNEDGVPDVAASTGNDEVLLLLGNGDGTFTAVTPPPATAGIYTDANYVVAADFNGDGRPDLAGVETVNNALTILLTQPTQTATATANSISPTGPAPHLVDASYPGDSNYTASVSGTTSLLVQAATPVISPGMGTYTSIQSVTITDATPGTTIYYTTDGSSPTLTSNQYTGPITVSAQVEVVSAVAVATGYESSTISSTLFILSLPAPASPVISLPAGVYSGAQSVTISTSTPQTSIYYTTNGAYPTTSSTLYTGPIQVTASETLVAVAAYGYSTSVPVSAQYILNGSSAAFIYTVAGDGIAGYSGDGGMATESDLNYPTATARDVAGNLYIADSGNNVVRKVTASTGAISTLAGNGIAGYSGDGGAATSAQLSAPRSVAIDSAGNVYISDYSNNVIRKIAASTGKISTYAGNGVQIYSGDNGPATSAGLGSPDGIALDAQGNLYIAEYGYLRVRKVTASTGMITTVAGSGQYGYAGDGGPAINASFVSPSGVAVDSSGNLYIADTFSNVVRLVNASSGVITTVAGKASLENYTGGYTGDGGPATSAELNSPEAVAVDNSGNLYIADTNNYVIRKVTASNGVITTAVGDGTGSPCYSFGGDGGPASSVALCSPEGVAVDGGGNLYIADSNESRIRKVTVANLPPTAQTAAPVLSVTAGTYASPQTVTITDATPGAEIYLTLNGTAPSTSTNAPAYNGPIDVTGSVKIGAIAVAPGYLASAPVTAAYTILAPTAATISTFAGSGAYGYSGAGGPATSAQINAPEGMAVDRSGNVYFADAYSFVIWMVSAKTGDISVYAGTGIYGYSGDGGPATAATLSDPMGIAFDSAGDLYIADSYNNVVRKVAAGTGLISTVAGNGQPGSVFNSNNGNGGLATAAALNNPSSVALDAAGNLYIAETGSNDVRMVSGSTGIITTVAGNGEVGFSGDGGAATSATVTEPNWLAFDSAGNLYIATSAVGRIRKVAAGTGVITTVAGDGDVNGDSGDGGPATEAEVTATSLTTDSAGNLYLSNPSASIRKIAAGTGIITRVAGIANPGFAGDGGPATLAEISSPQGITFDAAGDLYIADEGNFRVRKVTFASSTSTAAPPVFSVPAGTYTNTQTVSITDATTGAAIYYTTDGTTPTISSTKYGGSITVSRTETLEAIAVAPGYTSSAVASAMYTIQGVAVGTAAATVTVTPSASTITDQQAVSMTVSVAGGSGQPTPTGTITLAGASYNSTQTLSSGAATFKIPAGTLASGANTISASYSGDATYDFASGSATVTVSQITITLPTPPAISPGGSTTSTATLSAGSTYSGTLNLACSLTASAAGAQNLPTCSLAPASVTIASGSTGSSVLTVQTTAASNAALLQQPQPGQRMRWSGGIAALAVVLIFGVPARRRRWIAGLGLVLILIATAATGCGGGSNSTPPPSTPGTTAGNYTFTVTGTDASNTKITASATVVVTVQ
ncbi:FG-GAP-like repeat-containing protein [Acidicapsa ligni]|uniref:FG-GAP-like repeat-containing protein n=1 Tax=Acidicapsa ligni TaxID=542300 RepID=UPI0021E025A2|nr:FG-GAP-like repeat-containing protein [Acidicapsa ligni]